MLQNARIAAFTSSELLRVITGKPTGGEGVSGGLITSCYKLTKLVTLYHMWFIV